MDEAVTSRTWSNSLLCNSERAVDAIANIENLHNTLRANILSDFDFCRVAPEQVNYHSDKFKEATEKQKMSGNSLKVPGSARNNIHLLLVYQMGEPISYFDTFVHARKTSVVQLLDGCSQSVAGDNFLVCFILFRTILEQIAHFRHAIKQLDREFVKPAHVSEDQFFNKLSQEIKKLLLGTRFDWFGLKKQDVHEKLANKKYEYKPCDGEIDYRAKQVMTMIDQFEKVVPHVRGSYELLCEFAHPNMGVLYTMTKSTTSEYDKQGILWHKFSIGLGRPELQQDIDEVFVAIVETISKSLSQFMKELEHASEYRQRLLEAIQQAVRKQIARHPDLLDRYWDCPCRSGEKVKFCCERDR